MAKPKVYYNEFNKQKAAWLRQLIEEGAIAHGIVDERPIQAVQPEDLAGFIQCHFFAGIGLWSLCLRNAGWPDDRPVWTGSCPCGPFSIAGNRQGFEDPRHLWPEWFRLICVGRPDVLFGEQSADADAWIDLVSADLERVGYAIGSPDIPAAGFAGAHERQRFGFVADTHNTQWWSDRAPWNDGHWPKTGRVQGAGHLGDGGAHGLLADASLQRWGQEQPDSGRGGGGGGGGAKGRSAGLVNSGLVGQLGHAGHAGLPDAQLGFVRRSGWVPEGGAAQQPGDPSRPGADWLLCRDSRWRPVEPGTSPLVDADPARMGRLRGYGDAIDVEAFTNLIGAYLDCAPERIAA
jgi:DNA (cytosine-5)-methyltransferase 1